MYQGSVEVKVKDLTIPAVANESGSFRSYSRSVRSFRPDFRGESFRPNWDGSFRPSFKGGLFRPDLRGESFRPDLFISGKQGLDIRLSSPEFAFIKVTEVMYLIVLMLLTGLPLVDVWT